MKIILTYGKSNNNHGICGHFYEVCDYGLLLSKFFEVEILIREKYKTEDVLLAISKYTNKNQDKLLELMRFSNKKVIGKKGDIIIFTDGNVKELIDNKIILLQAKNIILFPCGEPHHYGNIPSIYRDKIIILHDTRLKYKLPWIPFSLNNHHYVKKINFDTLEPIETDTKDYLMYATSNCKLISNEIIFKYLNLVPNDSKLLILINEKSPLLNNKIEDDRVCYVEVPMDNLFKYFNTYIYTPIERKWDCSPRMIAECKYFGKSFIIDNEIDDNYLNVDLGLKYRLQDVFTNFESLFLNNDDQIIEICKFLEQDKSFQHYINYKMNTDFDEIYNTLKGI